MRKNGIRKQYLSITIAFLLISVLFTAGSFFYAKKTWDKLSEEQHIVIEKAQAMDDLADSINGLFLRLRGYYAFKIENELTHTYKQLENVHTSIEKLRTLDLTEEELEFVNDIDFFLIHFENSTLPNGLAYVADDDYQSLRRLSLDGTNTSINKFLEYSEKYNNQMSLNVIVIFEKTTKQLNNFFILLFVIGSILTALIIVTIVRVINHLIRPIEQMKHAADKYQCGHDFTFLPSNRTDELGELSNSFAGMIQTIISKEQELIAQNEELISQQDELFEKQKKIENALSEARFSKIRLERFNGLNHLLSYSIDKQELTDAVLAYFDELYSIDLGIFWLPRHGVYASKGIKSEMFDQFEKEYFPYFQTRLKQEPYFILKREATYEKGISNSETFVYDYIAGIEDSLGELNTMIALSRIGRPFSKEDLHDMYGLLKRVALAVDRIEQYELISHERTLNQNILDNVNEGICFISTSGGTDKFNRALLRMLGLPDDISETQLNGEDWESFLLSKVEDDGELEKFMHTALDSTAEVISHTSYTILGDNPKVMNVYSVPVIMGGIKAGTIFVYRDITQEHEIDRLKTELVSTVSHELRTPLSSVLGFTELLLNKQMNPEKQKRYLETIHKEAKRLTNLINDFLDLQRMEAGKQSYHMEDCNLSEIAEQVIENFRISDSHSITLINNTSTPAIFADKDRIIQVFTNLLSNAIKFSPDGVEIVVSLTPYEERIICSIKDNGIGIPSDQVNHMFEKFQRFDNSYRRKIGGTGLGLAICREIIEKHEGTIWIDSEENMGTTVSFSLPTKTIVLSHIADSNNPTILIVEDDTSVALLLGEELQIKGYSVIQHSQVMTAFKSAKDIIPACIVIDLLLDGPLTGWDLIKLLKDNQSTTHIPIIISSAIEKQDELIEKFHVDHYMTKPYPLHELTETVSKMLHLSDGRILYPENPFQ